MNLCYIYCNSFYDFYHYVFINLKFNSSIEKQNWLKNPFQIFFGKNKFYFGFIELEVIRQEISLPHEFIIDETKSNVSDEFYYIDRRYKKCNWDEEYETFKLDDCFSHANNTDEMLSLAKSKECFSYFLDFCEVKDYCKLEDSIEFLKKYKKLHIIDLKLIVFDFYQKSLQIHIIRYKEKIHLENFIKNNNLLKISIDVIFSHNDQIIGQTTFKYIAHNTDVDSFYMPAYMFTDLKDDYLNYSENIKLSFKK